MPRRIFQRAVRLPLLLACAALPVLAVAADQPWELELGGRRVALPATAGEEGPLFSLETLASALGLRFERPDRRSAVLEDGEGRRLLCQAGRSVVLVAGDVVLLDLSPDLHDGSLYVPAEFVGRALGAFLHREIRPVLRDGVLSLDAAASVPASWHAHDGRGDLVLGPAAEDGRLAVRREGDGLVVELPGRPALPQVSSPLLAGLSVDGGDSGTSRLHVRPAPGFVTVPVREGPGVLRVALVSREDVQGPRPEEAGPTTLSADTEGPGLHRIVLDPGHGGGETGAIGPGGLQEKGVDLAIALRLAAILEKAGIEVTLTRDADQEVPLDDRTATANQLRADLFVSLHANASTSPDATGAETFFLSREATDEVSRRVAAIESNTIGVRGDRLRGAPGALEVTLWEMAQSQYLQESQRLAERIQSQLNALAGTPDRGVHQAPLTVLMGATMPAVLVEVGFLSNPAEERKLRDPDHQGRVAEAIAEAILAFGKERREQASARGAP